MRNPEKDVIRMEERRSRILDVAFGLFAERSIESVSMQQVADACHIGLATVYRHFPRKQDLVVAIGSRRWSMISAEIAEKVANTRILEKSVREQFDFYLDCFIDLYKMHRRLLCFNYDFNRYIQTADVDRGEMETHLRAIGAFRQSVVGLYERGVKSGELRGDVSGDEMFLSTMHLMLAAATRYAVGLIYHEKPDGDLRELQMLKAMLFEEYAV